MVKKELDKLKVLALDYRANLIFTSWDCYEKDPNKWAENLRNIFMPIAFGGIKNTEASGVDGDIDLTTHGHTNHDHYTIVLELRKSY